MTCFWTGVVSALNHDDYALLEMQSTHDLSLFIRRLQDMAPDAVFDICWQSLPLTSSEIAEHKEAIKDYNISNIGHGHWTSSCDPFLCLLTDLLQIRIEFRYINTNIVFESKKSIRKTLKFAASESHFVRMC